MKKMLQRTCMGCNSVKDKSLLIRVVRNKNGKVFIDKTGKAEGRGAYICCNMECLKKVIKSKRLERSLKCKFDEGVYKDLENRIKTNGGEVIG